jgi:hypothetical protein
MSYTTYFKAQIRSKLRSSQHTYGSDVPYLCIHVSIKNEKLNHSYTSSYLSHPNDGTSDTKAASENTSNTKRESVKRHEIGCPQI